MKTRVVFDCMIFLQAAARPAGASGACFQQVESGRVELCLSLQTRAELHDVITRPWISRKFATLTNERVAEFLALVDRLAVLNDPVPEVVKLTRDPKDEKYLNLAVAAGAKLIVTRDDDLLDLMTGADPDAEALRKVYPDLAILEPVAFLQLIRQPALQDPTISEMSG